MRLATAAAEPPLEPPLMRSVFHGFRVGPNSSGSVNGREPELRRTGLAERDEAGVPEPDHQLAVVVGDPPFEKSRSRAHRLPGHQHREILEQERNPAEGAIRQSGGHFASGALEHRVNDSVEPGIQGFDPRDRGIDELPR